MRAGDKPVEAGRHRGVGGEEIARSRDGQRHLERLAGLFHEAAGALQHREGRVPFIEMTDFRLQAERPKQSPATDPEQQLLLAGAAPSRRRRARW